MKKLARRPKRWLPDAGCVPMNEVNRPVTASAEFCAFRYKEDAGENSVSEIASNCGAQHLCFKEKMNRRAQTGEQTMIFWFVFLLIIFNIGIIAGVYIFFGSEYDFRQVDAQALNYRVQKCLSENEINFEDSKELGEDFYQKCKINKEVVNETLFVLMSYNGKDYEAGPGDKEQCSLGKLNEKFPKCESSTLSKSGREFFIQTGSNQKLRSGVA